VPRLRAWVPVPSKSNVAERVRRSIRIRTAIGEPAAPKRAAKRVKKEECGRDAEAARNGAGRKREKLSLDDGTSVRACVLR
jgi:hypothetical protein